MKKIGKRIIFALLILFGFILGVKAEDETCTVDEKVRLKNLAAMVSVNYELTDLEDSPAKTMDIKIRNLSPELYVHVTSDYTNSFIVDRKDADSDGIITITKESLDKIANIKFSIYSNDSCSYQELRLIKLTTPMYNYDSGLDVCQDVPEFYLCQPFVTYDVNKLGNVDLVKAVQEYKEKLAEQEQKKALESKKEEKSKVLSKISDNKYLIVGLVVGLGIVITIIVLRKRGSVVK